MDNHKVLIVFFSLIFSFTLSAQADSLDRVGIRNNDPKLIGKIASLKKRYVEKNRVELAFEIILMNWEDAPKKIILAYPNKIYMYTPRVILFGYSENDWDRIDNGVKLQTNSLVVPGKSQKILIIEVYISNYTEEDLNSLLKLYIGGYKVSPTDWGKSIEIDFWIKPGDLPKLME